MRTLFTKMPQKICVVLCYHEVSDEDRQKFARQMAMVTRFAQPVKADLTTTDNGLFHQVAVTFDDGFKSVVKNAVPILLERQIPTTFFIPSGCLGRRPPWREYDGKDTVITAQELRQLLQQAPDLFDIGSHTVTHPHLCRIDESQATWELRESRQQIASLLGREVKLFCFPYGEYDEKILRLVEREKYSKAFSLDPMMADGHLLTGRIRVEPTDTPLEFFLKLHGAYRWIPIVKNKVNFLLIVRSLLFKL